MALILLRSMGFFTCVWALHQWHAAAIYRTAVATTIFSCFQMFSRTLEMTRLLFCCQSMSQSEMTPASLATSRSRSNSICRSEEQKLSIYGVWLGLRVLAFPCELRRIRHTSNVRRNGTTGNCSQQQVVQRPQGCKKCSYTHSKLIYFEPLSFDKCSNLLFKWLYDFKNYSHTLWPMHKREYWI